jgi:amino acid adenylation domain-containing protein
MELCRAKEVTLYTMLLAAFQVLLQRYTSQDELLIGTAYRETRLSAIPYDGGYFANVVVLHTDMSSNLRFLEVLEKVHEEVSKPNAAYEAKYEESGESLQQEKALNQVMFLFEKMVSAEPGSVEMPNPCTEGNCQKMACDLALTVQETERELKGSVTYRADLFEEATIARMMVHWQSLLEGIAADPTQSISALPLLTKNEQQQILVEWNDTYVDYPLDQCIHQLFEAQAEQTPEAVAIVSEAGKLTYSELNHRANQLAHFLQRCGVGPEMLVGLCVERSLEMLIGLLGILKAGGAYVPLDPTYPHERLAFMLADSQVPIVLTQERLVVSIPSREVEVVCLDANWDKISLESEENLVSGVMAENAAYVIYTSGSTGQPKGVVIQHLSLVNYILAACNAYAIRPEDRVLQFAPLSFDTSAEEIYPCLIRGATLVLRTNSMIDSISMFLQKCQEWMITVLDLPTAFWHELTRKIATDAITLSSPLRLVIIGGERALPEMLELWQKQGNRHVRLMNTYGPTEATIVATMFEVPQAGEASTAIREVPIGHPVSNAQVYLLDRQLNLVPVGVPGELYIGGIGLAREYLHRTVLTRDKFVPHPFDLTPDARLYKTGDRARYLPDGDIEFLGRFDQQVKIRGFRIELGEIETTLWKHPDVHEAVVVAREDASGGKRLVAYVVPRTGRSLTSINLRRFTQEYLPDYMVPAVIVLLDSLPLTPSGKIDRRGLPAPEQTRPEMPETSIVPLRAEHQQLIEVWEELLDVRPIGIQDNFFELGGHSLLAVRLVDRIEQLWGKKLAAGTLLANATVEQLVAALFVPVEVAAESTEKSNTNNSQFRINPGRRPGFKAMWDRLTKKH